ncbi:MAG: DUF748 domain-containing protein [Nibricoccus sp.]
MSTPSIKDLRQARARQGQRSPKWLRLLYIMAGLFAFYVIAGFFIAPPIVRSQLEKRLAAELHREVKVEKVSLNPLTLSCAIEGLVIRERDGKGSFVAWNRAFANFDSWSLFTGEWRFDEIALDGAEAHVLIDRDGKLNFADLLGQSAAPASGADAQANAQAAKNGAKTGEPRPLYVHRMSVSSAKIEYREDSQPEPFATVIGPVTFSLREFHTGGKNNAPGEFSATTEAGETIGWRGTLAVAPLRSAGEFSLGNVVLKKYRPYVGRFAQFAITDGTFGVKSRYELVFSKTGPALRLQEGLFSLKSFKLAARGEDATRIAVDSLEIPGFSADSDARTATLPRVTLAGGKLVATRDAQGIDLLRLLQLKPGAVSPSPSPAPTSGAAAATSSSSSTPATGAPFDMKLGELAVSGFTLELGDTTTPRPARLELEQISLQVKDVSLLQLGKASPLQLGAALKGGGTIMAAGSLAPQPLRGEISLEIENAPLSVVSPYVETFVNVRIAQGSASLKTRVVFDSPASGGSPAITATAEASIRGFQVIEGEGTEELARWKTLSLRGIEAATSPSLKLLVADIEWTDPVGSVVIGEDGKMNLAGLLATPPSSSAPAAPASVPAVSFNKAGKGPAPETAQSAAFIAIDRFQLNNAAFTFTDRSMEPDVKLALNQLTGSVTGLSSAVLARADVDLKGQVDGVAPVSIRGQINPLAAEAFTDLKLNFRSIDLRPTGPYVAKYAGYELDRGALTLDVKVKLDQRRVDSTTVVTLDPFMLGAGSNSPDATKLPVKLGLAILRDRNGRIALPPVPVDGSLDDPKFRLGRVIWYAVGNVFAKAATSPFSVLGSMFGGGRKSEELAFQEFVPGTAELTDDSIKKLDVLAKALTERPELRLDVAGSYGVAVDTPTLRERELDKGLRVAFWESQRKAAGPGVVVPPPEQITLTPEDTERLVAMFYRMAFEPKEPAKPGEPGKKTEDVSDETKSKSQFWTPVVRMFRRGGAPVSATPKSAATPKPPPPKPYTTTSTAGTTPAGSPGASASGQADAVPPGPTYAEMRAKLLAAIPVDENALRELAGERARRVRSYLIEGGQIDAGRISLVGEMAKGPRVDLQLK